MNCPKCSTNPPLDRDTYCRECGYSAEPPSILGDMRKTYTRHDYDGPAHGFTPAVMRARLRFAGGFNLDKSRATP